MHQIHGTKSSTFRVLQGLSIVPGVVLPLVSIWFLPVILLSMAAFLLLQEQGKKHAVHL